MLATVVQTANPWRLEKIERAGSRWRIIISHEGETAVITAGARQLSWPVFQSVAFIQTGIWPVGYDRARWRAAIVQHLARLRQGVAG